MKQEFYDPAMDNDHAMRTACKTLCEQFPGAPRLKTFAVVGARDIQIGSPEWDSRVVTTSFAYMLRSGFIIQPDYKIDTFDFRNGRDFLAEGGRYDGIFIAMILNDYTGRFEQYKDFRFHGKPVGDITYGFCRSPLHNDRNWRQHALGVEAKVVFTFGGCHEIGTRVFHAGFLPRLFNSNVFEELVPTPDIDTRDIRLAETDPLPGLGYCARRDYLVDSRKTFSDSTSLGRTAKEKAVLSGFWLDMSGLLPVPRAMPELQGDDIGLEGP